MSMTQPNWKLIYATDYSALFEDTTGVYPPEMMIAQEINDAPDEERYAVYRFAVERCALDRADRDDPTARQYLVPASIAGRNDLPHPIPSYQEWFADDLPSVASSVGSTAEDLIDALCCEDAGTRAEVYEAIGGYFGYDNLDSYPEVWSQSDMDRRWGV